MKPISSFLQDFNFSDNRLFLWRLIDDWDYYAPLFLSFSFVFVVFWYTWLFANEWRWSLPQPPGPRGVPVLGNLPFLKPELHTYFAELGRRYGPIVKLQLGKKICIVVNSPSVAREIFKDHDVTFANRDVPLAGKASTYGGCDILWSPYGPEWRMLRKVSMLKMLSNTTLDSVYALRRREIRNTVRYLYSQVGSPINVGEQAFLTILNVITDMLWGGTVEGEERKCIAEELRGAVSEMTRLFMKPNISDFFPRLARFDFQGIEKQTRKLAQKFDRIFTKMIDQRLEMANKGDSGNADQRNDFLQFLLELKDKGDSKTPFTTNHLKALLMDMVVGGTDTSSNTIEFAMAEMMKNPQVLKKAQEELAAVVGEDNIVEEFHVQNLPYLQAIMKETLRFHPALPLLAPHSPSETAIVSHYTIPKGCRVLINAWAIHRDLYYWEKPLEFKPERFLNNSWDYSGVELCYIPFGSGRRICAGIAMAEKMVLYLLATMLHSFDWKLEEGEEMEVSEKFGTVLKKKRPLVAIPTPRLADLALYQ